MKALELLKEKIFKLCMSKDGVWISPEELDETAKELEKTVKENSNDRLEELEKVILDYYLAKGYQIGADGLGFKVRITTLYQWKLMHVILLYPTKLVFQVITETPKEMFDKAFKYFSIKDSNAK